MEHSRVRKNFIWGEEQQRAWTTLKRALLEAPMLATPDWSKPFFLATDACKTGISAIFFQSENGELKIDGIIGKNNNHKYIAMMSRAKEQRNHTAQQN